MGDNSSSCGRKQVCANRRGRREHPGGPQGNPSSRPRRCIHGGYKHKCPESRKDQDAPEPSSRVSKHSDPARPRRPEPRHTQLRGSRYSVRFQGLTEAGTNTLVGCCSKLPNSLKSTGIRSRYYSSNRESIDDPEEYRAILR